LKNKIFCYGLVGLNWIGTLLFSPTKLKNKYLFSVKKTQNSSDEIESDVLITVANNNSSNNIQNQISSDDGDKMINYIAISFLLLSS
jgi:hypothetical protein